ncbi:MAG TPA: hypothetical protein VNF07_03370 [Acidimicrobiales bacterium]|nr:hypothetical protein [Acidimicrobiales bacterium]
MSERRPATVFITSEWDEDEPAVPRGIYSTPDRAMSAIDEEFSAQDWVEQAVGPDGLRHWRGGAYLWVDEVFLDRRL